MNKTRLHRNLPNHAAGRTQSPGKRSRGFTIVELLIVIVVIAILAAITIVAYQGIQARAQETVLASDANRIAKQLQTHRTAGDQEGFARPSQFDAVGLSVNLDPYNATIPNLIYAAGQTSPATGSEPIYVLIAQSKSGKRYAMLMNGSIEPYSGPWYVDGSFDMLNYLRANYMKGGNFEIMLGVNPSGTTGGWAQK